MVQSRPQVPLGHGEVLARPEFSEWAPLVERNRAQASAWDFTVGGLPVQAFRVLARSEALSRAEEFSQRLGVTVRPAGDPDAPIVVTGHQPEIYHPGVWVKDFLLQRLADEVEASALDIVVDTDGFDSVGVTAPCMSPEVTRCRQYLAIGAAESSFAFAQVPSAEALETFCSASDTALASLSAPAVRRHFATFCDALRSARVDAADLAELVTFARRRYEAPAGTDYLELPVTVLSRAEAWMRFVAHLALDADAFAAAYNAELAEYRVAHRTRSTAQPFPDLAVGDDVELPLWLLQEGRRASLSVRRVDGAAVLLADGRRVVSLGSDIGSALEALTAAGERGVSIAPKALALTIYTRMFCCDLFIHGVGGGRYDRVADGVMRRYWGVEPPAFVVASMTMFLPLGVHMVTEEEVAAAKERLGRLTHNPDGLLGEVEFDDPAEQVRAAALAVRKAELVAAIAQPDADKKRLGASIRETNAELAGLLAPLREQWEQEVASLEAQLVATEVLTDRTYPFCFWSPHEVADKVG